MLALLHIPTACMCVGVCRVYAIPMLVAGLRPLTAAGGELHHHHHHHHAFSLELAVLMCCWLMLSVLLVLILQMCSDAVSRLYCNRVAVQNHARIRGNVTHASHTYTCMLICGFRCAAGCCWLCCMAVGVCRVFCAEY